ncbi:MAG: Holliday junction ATP-dependent DNA helicase RuvA [Candidatus Nomurabacteria bacterium GW2011_GWE1_32_28]|uniref:Holliday junction branch migration complex subunit RuvA n=1 Tax=Candidatus Nomurabacteria bacterium GW2011_GWF1_31_48 TaxID=1618767 RepID=A0A0F9YFZ9_9BACT|nr:MAG: Holliday junction ATP-dependent DNA helicase RuvA [Candidatus Nomurabacteria bacterium GW2011_GWF2_30_133]KKP28770.1 MAG: Holliday junction ATP-dependent DNA helicase RuvA [Candidatus Nomurabacteria bacterium GW2011_GWE2_31_40]KKP30348.1 MAG: Holliday junction ATP-dependent DNA helicase RuvA [Candidatus Nomurabacteria bacterium GW2011_GWF1_31_48]KKP34875.1 MAG: Holliday junction ATP-dependent DNA helicase RuvA [Candidatus Nomurabacteria bacterium GW2011_GWE1_32_28]HAS80966.1 Holliday ju
MIGSIKGKIIYKTDKSLVVETAGVGYKISISPDTLSKLKKTDEEVFFWIHTHVREDILDLYGFLNREELEFFEMLINVSGIGPKGALSVLGVASIETLKRAISTSDTAYLTKVSGIGKKTAEKIIIELRDKMQNKTGEKMTDASLRDELDALEALKSLGYSQNEAREALKKVSPDINTNTKIREALKILANK